MADHGPPCGPASLSTLRVVSADGVPETFIKRPPLAWTTADSFGPCDLVHNFRPRVELRTRDGCLIINPQPNSANFQGQWEDITSLLAKLISRTARQTQDADGTDELVMSKAGGSIFERMSVRKDDEFDFDADRLLPFDDQVEIVLTEVDSESHQHQNLGSVIIRADEHNRGELTQQFRGAGAL